MATASHSTAQGILTADQARDGLANARAATLELVAPISTTNLERSHSALMSPLVWDLGHIAAYEDLWLVHRHGARPLLHPELAALYDAFETPRAVRAELELLDRGAALEYMAAVRERTLDVIDACGVGSGLLHELVIQHEHQHLETMLQTIELARLDGVGGTRGMSAVPEPAPRTAADPGLEFVEVPAGPFWMGAGDGGFSYDNERPRRGVEVAPFRIARTTVSNGSWLRFAEGGGYERREWWSDEGWSWKEEYDIERPGGWSADGREWRLSGWEALDPQRPVVHVSWYEADAFARAHGCRLPTEAEWEKAATWYRGGDRDGELASAPPPGDGLTGQREGLAGNLRESGILGTTHVGAFPATLAPSGAADMIGGVWEWTASHFRGYPDFVAHPYREYSEVFFGSDYRVLRGGSWATSARVATATFRNWDLPQRRQIFAGVRLAADA